MKASKLIDIYGRRRAGYEEGLLKYPAPLYEAVCALLTRLAGLPSDEEVRIDGDAIFVVPRTGVVLARFPGDSVLGHPAGDAG